MGKFYKDHWEMKGRVDDEGVVYRDYHTRIGRAEPPRLLATGAALLLLWYREGGGGRW